MKAFFFSLFFLNNFRRFGLGQISGSVQVKPRRLDKRVKSSMEDDVIHDVIALGAYSAHGA